MEHIGHLEERYCIHQGVYDLNLAYHGQEIVIIIIFNKQLYLISNKQGQSIPYSHQVFCDFLISQRVVSFNMYQASK